jgi:rhomboid protease GluP
MTFSLAAASRSLAAWIPAESPVTYVTLGVNALLFIVSMVASAQMGGQQGFSLFGGINGEVLMRLGARQSILILNGEWWRLVVPIFLHGGLLHIVMNSWVLMDLGPQLEELYGSARYLFLYVAIGIFSFVVSTVWNLYTMAGYGLAIGASGSLMGLIGLMLAVTTRRGGAMMQMMRRQLIKWVIYIFILGFVIGGIDNAAHFGGLVAGYGFGRVFADREPMNAVERTRAYALGWSAALVVIGSFAAMLLKFFHII